MRKCHRFGNDIISVAIAMTLSIMTLMQGGFGMLICQDFHLKEAMDILLLILLSVFVLFVFYRITDRMTI